MESTVLRLLTKESVPHEGVGIAVAKKRRLK
jgi:hypothetical protein